MMCACGSARASRWAAASVAWGTVPETVEINEYGVRYLVDPWGGQKTGFFLDQREKRRLVADMARNATTLLNCFSYSGGFALAALAKNPALRTVNVDASAPALDLAQAQLHAQRPRSRGARLHRGRCVALSPWDCQHGRAV